MAKGGFSNFINKDRSGLAGVANMLLKMQDKKGPFSKTIGFNKKIVPVDMGGGVQAAAQALDPITSNDPSLADIGGLVKGVASAHPFLSAGSAIGTGANIAGLMDNDKFGGQLAGLLAGGLGSYKGGLWNNNPLIGYAVTTGAGALGALFDKLRAKKEQESAQAQSYYQ